MKKFKPIASCAAVFAALLLAFALWTGLTPVSLSASAAERDFWQEDPYYDFEISNYSVVMDVGADRRIAVTENISVHFLQSRSGIIRDFPLESGVRYYDISALRNGSYVYTQCETEYAGYLSLYIGREGDWLQSGDYADDYVYTISYTMSVPKLKEEGYLPLDVIGYDWQAPIYAVSVTVNCPEGLKENYVYSGWAGTTGNDRNVECTRSGNVLTLTTDYLGYSNGITLDLSFEKGVLTAPFDLTILWVLLIGLGIVAASVLVKLFLCRQPLFTKTVNFTAPKDMDPLCMGKLIDNVVDGEDLGALVFWLASEGYLNIDLTENDEDPTLIRTEKPLPGSMPAHVRTFYNGLFRKGGAVRVSSLKNTFYTTADEVKKTVSAATGTLYSRKSFAVIAVLGALCALLLGGFCWAYGFLHVMSGYHYWFGFMVSLFGFGAGALSSMYAEMQRFKKKRATAILLRVVGVVIGVVFALLGFAIPHVALPGVVVFLCGALSTLVGTVAGFCLTRTEEYAAKLGEILGFKDFILYTEKDKIAFMLKENPELYYSILPYAQVLGITDAWTDKFEGLNLSAPSYMSYTGHFVFQYAMFRTLTTGFSRSFVSRPTNSGSRGFGGGSGGGFGGGGFGGGGGRSF